jgi:hypothetical protein
LPGREQPDLGGSAFPEISIQLQSQKPAGQTYRGNGKAEFASG